MNIEGPKPASLQRLAKRTLPFRGGHDWLTRIFCKIHQYGAECIPLEHIGQSPVKQREGPQTRESSQLKTCLVLGAKRFAFLGPTMVCLVKQGYIYLHFETER